jgi:hypothetical protein
MMYAADSRPSALVIFGARFSGSGNKVVVEQAGRKYFAPRDEVWSEAATKITASLPAGIVPGRALVYVLDSGGRESNARAIHVQRGSQRRRPFVRR